MTRHNRPLAQVLIRRLTLIATVIVVLNMVVVGLYYGSDRPELEAEVVADAFEPVALGTFPLEDLPPPLDLAAHLEGVAIVGNHLLAMG